MIAKKLGLELLDDQYVSRYGGNIRAYLGAGQPLRNCKKDESLFLNDFKSMATDVKDWIHSTKQLIEELNSKYGKLRAKAFPGRAWLLKCMIAEYKSGCITNLIICYAFSAEMIVLRCRLPKEFFPSCSLCLYIPIWTSTIVHMSWKSSWK